MPMRFGLYDGKLDRLNRCIQVDFDASEETRIHVEVFGCTRKTPEPAEQVGECSIGVVVL